MRHLPVHWSEGMFLRPHHFQAADRHWGEKLALSQTAEDPCSYGIVRIEIDPTALANRQLELRACQARLRDGTLVWLEPGEEPDRINLEQASKEIGTLSASLDEAIQAADAVRVYLAVPRFDPSGPNVSPPGPADRSRVTTFRQTLQDDTSGGNDQEIEFRRLNVRLRLSTEDLSGYELLQIAQIRQAGNREAAPEIDPDYFPPMLSVDAWPPLGRDLVQSIYDLLGRKVTMEGVLGFEHLRGKFPQVLVAPSRGSVVPWVRAARLEQGQKERMPALDLREPLEKMRDVTLKREADRYQPEFGQTVRVYTLYGREAYFFDEENRLLGDMAGMRPLADGKTDPFFVSQEPMLPPSL